LKKKVYTSKFEIVTTSKPKTIIVEVISRVRDFYNRRVSLRNMQKTNLVRIYLMVCIKNQSEMVRFSKAYTNILKKEKNWRQGHWTFLSGRFFCKKKLLEIVSDEI
jgi:hypothetical protein